MPTGQVPVDEGARLQGSHALEKPGHAAPRGLLPRGVSLDPEKGGNEGAESAEGGRVGKLPDLFAQFDVERRGAQTGRTVGGVEGLLERQAGQTEEKEDGDNEGPEDGRPHGSEFLVVEDGGGQGGVDGNVAGAEGEGFPENGRGDGRAGHDVVDEIESLQVGKN